MSVPAQGATPQVDLTGYTYSEAEPRGLALVKAEAPSVAWFDAMEQHVHHGPLGVFRSVHPPSASAAAASPGPRRLCSALMPHTTWPRLCDVAVDLLEALDQDALPPLDWSSKRLGLADWMLDYDLAVFKWRGVDVRYRIQGKPGMLNERIITLAHAGQVMELFVSPGGALFGGKAWRAAAEPTHSAHLYREHTIYFDDAFSSLGEESKQQGHRAMLQRSMREVLAARQAGMRLRLPTDHGEPLDYPARALILDDGLDLGNPALAARIRLNAEAVQTLLERGVVNGTLLDTGDAAAQYMRAFTTSPWLDHGTNTAALLLADMPLAQASWVDTLSVQRIDPSELREVLEKKIATDHPRVVNITMSFSASLPSCEQVFAPLFREHLDDVLFVVAAGNYGEKDSPEVCPASIAWKYPNVLSVAGTDDSGRIHRESNWGPRLAQVTAPFCAETLAPLAPREHVPKLVRECGTSISTPIIGNKALKLFAQHPSMTAPEAAFRLMADDPNLAQNYE